MWRDRFPIPVSTRACRQGRWRATGLLSIALVLLLSLAACERPGSETLPSPTASTAAPAEPSGSALASDSLIPRQARDNDIRFERISHEAGLSQSVINCILQDSTGFMWFGTQDGLNRYDGYEFVVFEHDPDDPSSLADNYVAALVEDPAGLLWIGTHGGGLDRYDPHTGQFSHYVHDPSEPNSLGDDSILDLFQDSTGILWIGTPGGLDRFDPLSEQFLHFLPPAEADDPSGSAAEAIYVDQEQRVWLGTPAGLDLLDPTTGQFTPYRHDPADSTTIVDGTVHVIAPDREGMLWIGTEKGLDQFDPHTGQFVHYLHDPSVPQSLTDSCIQTIMQDRRGVLWIGTAGGLDRFDPASGEFVHYTHDPRDAYSLSNNDVKAIFQDREGVLWVGTFGGGINRTNQEMVHFALYQSDPDDPNSLSGDLVWSLYQDRAGMLWVGTNGGGLNRFDPSREEFTHFQNDPTDPYSLGGDTVWSIYQDRVGSLWIGTSNGLDRFLPGSEQFLHYPTFGVMSIFEDRNRRLWVGTIGGGLGTFDPAREQFDYYGADAADPDTADNAVISVYEDQEGMLWIGTLTGGLERLDPQSEEFVRYRNDPNNPHSLSHNTVLCTYQDRQGTLWVGTMGGLNRFDRTTQRFTHYLESDGLPSDVIYGILEDDQGDLWLSTNGGISRFDPRTETFRNYDVADGLQSNEFNQGAYHRSSNGEMFFGGIQGFNAFYPDRIPENPYIPPVVLTSLTQGGMAIEPDRAVERLDQVTLHWPNNFFEFEFSALSYVQSARNQYAYILEGFDEQWNEIGTRRFGRYTNIPAGRYVLRIRGSNNDGVWNESGTALAITIVPPFWATWWFRGIVALLLVGGLVGGYRLRVQSIEARNRELETLVAERTHALAQRTHEIERRRRELETLYRADEEIYRYIHLNQVLQALVDTAVGVLQADKGSLMVWDDQRERLVVRAIRGFDPETVAQLSLAPGEGVAGQVAVTGRPIIVKDARSDPRTTKRIVERENIVSFMQVPIDVGGEVFGVFSADYVQPHSFDEDEQRLLMALAQRAALAIEKAQYYAQMQELAIMEERQRLARELHDSVTQSLYGVTLYAEAADRLLSSGENGPASGYLHDLRATAQEALREMRLLIFELRPLALEKEGLAVALQARLETVEARAGVQTSLNVDGVGQLPLKVEEGLYRIAQEALNNALKHAQSHSIGVTLDQHQRTVALEITDDGVGFDPSTVVECGGLGLHGMAERATQMGGRLSVQSAPGAGTCIRVEVDL